MDMDKTLQNEVKPDESLPSGSSAESAGNQNINPDVIGKYFTVRASGDITLGNYSGGQGIFWDQSAGTLNILGSLSVTSLNIPDTTTANSFHVDSMGNSWWGANVATGYAGAAASILSTGVASFSSVTITNPSTSFVQVPLSRAFVAGENISANDAVFIPSNNISYDSTTSSQGFNVTSLTYSHTCSGSSLVLVVSVILQGTVNDPSSVTYNGVNMTKGVSNPGSGQNVSLWYLGNPTLGANNVIVNCTSSRIASGAISLAGADTNSPLGVTGINDGTSITPTVTVTTTAVNSYLVDAFYLNDNSKTAAVNGSQILRYNEDIVANGTRGEGSTLVTGSIGSYTMSWTLSGSQQWRNSVIEIKPANDGKIRRASASFATTSDSYIGFSPSAITNGNTGNIVIGGEANGLSGLSTGTRYYIGNAAGSISTTPGSVTRKAGIATSATTLLITNIW